MVLRRFSCLIITMCKALIRSKRSVRFIASKAIQSLTPLETTISSVVSNTIPPPVLSTPIASPFIANVRCLTILMILWFSVKVAVTGFTLLV
ncbi:hypothetical protein Gogos_017359 [Gossypium gossypioides]|uniref:Uncharacterized protein n=1 Tax=Gossypium gossypioides TaxID=34282 RepID=A0A7J9BC78_GOSGO|nr:hypothetical protein [Gossypium gossypioides]